MFGKLLGGHKGGVFEAEDAIGSLKLVNAAWKVVFVVLGVVVYIIELLGGGRLCQGVHLRLSSSLVQSYRPSLIGTRSGLVLLIKLFLLLLGHQTVQVLLDRA